MRICDRCHEPAMDSIVIKSTDEHKDVCQSCMCVFMEFFHDRQQLTKPVEKGTTKGRGLWKKKK